MINRPIQYHGLINNPIMNPSIINQLIIVKNLVANRFYCFVYSYSSSGLLADPFSKKVCRNPILTNYTTTGLLTLLNWLPIALPSHQSRFRARLFGEALVFLRPSWQFLILTNQTPDDSDLKLDDKPSRNTYRNPGFEHVLVLRIQRSRCKH